MPQNTIYDAAFFSTNTTDKLTELVKELTTVEGEKAKKALNYYDGKQEEELEKFFNLHRKDWKIDHLIPRTRNITKMVVEKSGQIVHDTPPIYEVHTGTGDDLTLDQALSERLIDLFNKADSIETWMNLDEMVRLLKTTLVLVGWDAEADALVYDLLHRGNCVVKWNNVTKTPELLLYNLYSHETFESYRVIVEDLVIDFNFELGAGKVTVTNQEENLLGIVPVAQFYDTAAPRVGFWNVVPIDLVNVNEVYNVAMSDSEYAMQWMKRPTLFTNAMLADTHIEATSPFNTDTSVSTVKDVGSKFPRQVGSSEGRVKFGPSTAVQLDTNGVDGAQWSFEAPVVDLSPLDDVINNWVEAVASDWSVRAKVGGTGSASSGFQLVVEELPNLELRKQRQKMFAVGLTRLFEVIKVIANTHTSTTFSDESKLFVTYAEPSLPIESKLEEEIWTTRISEGRATLADYFIETKGMSPDEAVDKIGEIIEFNAKEARMRAAEQTRVVPQAPPEPEEESEEEEDE